MLITLLSTKARSINLIPTEPEGVEKDVVSMKLGVSYADTESKEFLLTFEVGIKSEQGFMLTVIYDSIFACDSAIDEDFKNGHFPRINAPAIAYPFLRSFISTVTVNAGYSSIIIPTINFKALESREMRSDSKAV